MENYFFMKPLLRLLGQRDFFYRVVAITMRVVAGILVLSGLAMFFKAGKSIFDFNKTGEILGGILFLLFFVIAMYAVVHILLIRARDVEALKADNELHMLPLGALLIRMLGEVYFIYVSLIAIGGTIFFWFTSKAHITVMNPIPAFFPSLKQTDFVDGVVYMLAATLVSFLILVVAYMIAETINIIVRSLRKAMTPQQVHPKEFRRYGS